jgi:hypothetical protein
VDTNPRWTIGYNRPLYVERKPRCIACEENTGSAGRAFIPKRIDIPSISSRRLFRFYKAYHHFSKEMQAMILNSYLPTSQIQNATIEPDDEREVSQLGLDNYSTDDAITQENESLVRKRIPQTSPEFLHPGNPTRADEPHQEHSGKIGDIKQTAGDASNVQIAKAEFQRLLREPSDCVGLPTEVEIWCCNCQDSTEPPPRSKLVKGNDITIDESPRWTKGRLATYLPPKIRCLKCGKRHSKPRNSDIPSMDQDNLRAWIARNCRMSDAELNIFI